MWSDEAGLTAAAQALATQALPVFFAALLLVLIFAACAWWVARRYAVPRGRSDHRYRFNSSLLLAFAS